MAKRVKDKYYPTNPNFNYGAWWRYQRDNIRYPEGTDDNWLVTATNLDPGGRFHFRRGRIAIQDIFAAIEKTWPNGDVFVAGWHGNTVYIERREEGESW